MRVIRIFLLHFQVVFAERSRTLVWFLTSLIGPLTMILFWKGAGNRIVNWNFSQVTAYYFLLIIATALLMCHVEDDVANLDIHEGNLVRYLIRPFPYFWMKFLEDISWRLIQGIFGIIVLFFAIIFFGMFFSMTTNPPTILLACLIALLSFFMTFIYKMVLGIAGFWMSEMRGLFEFSDMLMFITAGYIAPLFLFPQQLERIAYFLPFSYMIYFPVVSFQGKFSTGILLSIIGIQLLWICLFACLYGFLWKKGVKKFTGVGQ
jgi:ABC-2 type transport system permease protein